VKSDRTAESIYFLGGFAVNGSFRAGNLACQMTAVGRYGEFTITAIMCIAQLCALRFKMVTGGFGIFRVFHMMNGLFDAHNSRDSHGGACGPENSYQSKCAVSGKARQILHQSILGRYFRRCAELLALNPRKYIVARPVLIMLIAHKQHRSKHKNYVHRIRASCYAKALFAGHFA
jgi:hypothetical protein